MYKRIALLMIMILCLLIFCGCRSTAVDDLGNEREIYYGLMILKERKTYGDGVSFIAYEPETKVCYIVTDDLYRLSMTPYYIVNENGAIEVAVYGRNYDGK